MLTDRVGILFLWIILAICTSATAEEKCKYPEEPILKPVWSDPQLGKSGPYDPGDYEMELQADFSYFDCSGNKHTAPRGTVVNGASIPRLAWTPLNYTPWSGPIQKPSIIHDHMCEKVVFTSATVHKLFHEGLLTAGADETDAALMYAAVSNFGPQWSAPGGAVTRPTYVVGFLTLLKRMLFNSERIVRRDDVVVMPKGAMRRSIITLEGRPEFERSYRSGITDPELIDALSQTIKELPLAAVLPLATEGRSVVEQ